MLFRRLVAFTFCFAGTLLAMWSFAAKPIARSTSTLAATSGSWSLVDSPNAEATQTPNSLNGTTCVSASDCWAVGYYVVGTTQQTLIEHWDGTEWTIVTSPNDPTAPGHFPQ